MKVTMRDKEQAPHPTFEQLYGILLDAMPSSMLVVDRAMRIVSANRNFLERSLRTEANTLGRPLTEVFPPIILEHTNIEGHIRSVFRTGEPLRGQRMTYRAPGISIRIYYYSILPITFQGSIAQVMLLMEDVTEQVRLSEEVRLIERHLASVVESASDIVVSTDTQGRILTWNSAAERLSGLPLRQVRGLYFYEVCDPAQQQEARTVVGLMQQGSMSHTAEWRLVGANGESIPVSWVLSPMRDDYGAPVGVVAVGRDLTERRKLESELRKSQKLASLGVMAGGIAHEIRNPLAVCASAAQFLKEENLDPAFRAECIEKILTGTQKASTIIENLLRFARPSPDTEMREVNLSEVLEESITLIANQAKVQKIKIERELTPNMRVRGVASLLQQVFINLMLNAINAMPNGGNLKLTTRTSENEVMVEIIDTGVGIPEADLERIFDPFMTTSTVGKGTGLGLSICYSIVKQHLGSISVESEEGVGSTFTVRLPLL